MVSVYLLVIGWQFNPENNCFEYDSRMHDEGLPFVHRFKSVSRRNRPAFILCSDGELMPDERKKVLFWNFDDLELYVRSIEA